MQTPEDRQPVAAERRGNAKIGGQQTPPGTQREGACRDIFAGTTVVSALPGPRSHPDSLAIGTLDGDESSCMITVSALSGIGAPVTMRIARRGGAVGRVTVLPPRTPRPTRRSHVLRLVWGSDWPHPSERWEQVGMDDSLAIDRVMS
jgi:hypothetical protein